MDFPKYEAGNTRGENAAALVFLHLTEEVGRHPTDEELKKFIIDNGLLGLMMTMDWEEVSKKLDTLKAVRKGEEDGN